MVTAPERSYEITGDEKWIDENGGREILERVKLLEKLKIIQCRSINILYKKIE